MSTAAAATAANAATYGNRATDQTVARLRLVNMVSFVAAEGGAFFNMFYLATLSSIVLGICQVILFSSLFFAEFSFSWLDKYFGFLVPRLGRGIWHFFIGWNIVAKNHWLTWILGIIVMGTGLFNLVLWRIYRYDERVNGRPPTTLNMDGLKRGRIEELPADGSIPPASTSTGAAAVASTPSAAAAKTPSYGGNQQSNFAPNPYSDEQHQAQPQYHAEGAPVYDSHYEGYEPTPYGQPPRSESLETNEATAYDANSRRTSQNDNDDYVDVNLKI